MLQILRVWLIQDMSRPLYEQGEVYKQRLFVWDVSILARLTEKWQSQQGQMTLRRLSSASFLV